MEKRRRKPGPGKATTKPPKTAEEERRERFARSLTRSVLGRNYWDDRMTDELARAMRRRPPG